LFSSRKAAKIAKDKINNLMKSSWRSLRLGERINDFLHEFRQSIHIMIFLPDTNKYAPTIKSAMPSVNGCDFFLPRRARIIKNFSSLSLPDLIGQSSHQCGWIIRSGRMMT
jgi:hypothetical protein